MTANQLNNADFYIAMATTLPLLFIVLLIQYRGTGESWDNDLRSFLTKRKWIAPLVALFVGLWIGLGEFAALDVLRRRHVTIIDRVLVDGGLSLAALGLLVPITLRLTKDFKKEVGVKNEVAVKWLARAVYLVVGVIWLLAVLYFMPASPFDRD